MSIHKIKSRKNIFVPIFEIYGNEFYFMSDVIMLYDTLGAATESGFKSFFPKRNFGINFVEARMINTQNILFVKGELKFDKKLKIFKEYIVIIN